ncbi:unnamed protein product, partial [marine sediment metagenome]
NKGIQEISGDDFEHNCYYNKKKACDVVVDLVKTVIDNNTHAYFSHLKGMQQLMQRNFLRYIGKRLFIAGDE